MLGQEVLNASTPRPPSALICLQLALPAVSAPAGTLPTAAGLVGIHVLLTASALLIAEVNIAAREARDARDPAASGVVTVSWCGASHAASHATCKPRARPAASPCAHRCRPPLPAHFVCVCVCACS